MAVGIFKGMDRYQLHMALMAEIEEQKKIARRGKTDIDVIRENHQFLWDDSEQNLSWERQLAKSYYSKLFREYCICDLSQYKRNQVGLRWRTENEIVLGRGQFLCGNKHCQERERLASWEVNFNYVEHGQRKSALVKVRLCPDCSRKLNYHTKKRLAKRRSKSIGGVTKRRPSAEVPTTSTAAEAAPESAAAADPEPESQNIWAAKDAPVEDKSREEEFNDYLEDLLL
ncbi:protein FRA10AC1 homolog [Phlebotomus argentipes]|uniref:protein FRA10AC1 homolog n=1 Tax=Phlebotomus argentipes TaxID=94469 RepID=UPI00289324EB|nr:protein FRA10AC1 homolog [Phlebotomus argentipes]